METTSNESSYPDRDSALAALRLSQTRLAATETALQKAEERALAGRLALEVLHEIRNPLEALGHLVYMTVQDAQEPEAVLRNMQLAEEQMATVREISQSTLGFAQNSKSPKSMDLARLAQAAIRIHQQKIQEKSIHLVIELPERVVAEVYSGEMLQVLSNLLINAIEALSAEGVLRLRLRRRQARADFVIADNGHGIPAHHEEAIFQPFFTTKADRGTGLGLALSKRIIDRHSGMIRMRSSVRPGKCGTTFKISLPLH